MDISFLYATSSVDLAFSLRFLAVSGNSLGKPKSQRLENAPKLPNMANPCHQFSLKREPEKNPAVAPGRNNRYRLVRFEALEKFHGLGFKTYQRTFTYAVFWDILYFTIFFRISTISERISCFRKEGKS